jgi:hypothetical protein
LETNILWNPVKPVMADELFIPTDVGILTISV